MICCSADVLSQTHRARGMPARRYYKREIAAYDIKTHRCDVYGEDMNYRERVMLIYDGLHYDALSLAAFQDAPEEIDVSVFDPKGPQGSPAHQGALELAKKVLQLLCTTGGCRSPMLPIMHVDAALLNAACTCIVILASIKGGAICSADGCQVVSCMYLMHKAVLSACHGYQHGSCRTLGSFRG